MPTVIQPPKFICSNHELWSWSDDPEELAYYNKLKKEMDDRERSKKEYLLVGYPHGMDK